MRLSVLHSCLNCVDVILHTAWVMMLIYCRYQPVTAQMNLTFQGDGSTDRFIKCFKPRRKYMYHLFYVDKALHVSHAVNVCMSSVSFEDSTTIICLKTSNDSSAGSEDVVSSL